MKCPRQGHVVVLCSQDCLGYKQGQLTGQQLQGSVMSVAHKLKGLGESGEYISDAFHAYGLNHHNF